MSILDVNNIEGYLSRREVRFLGDTTMAVLREFGEKSVLCEIGSYYGKSTIAMGKVLAEEGKGTLFAVDWHHGSPEFSRNGESQCITTYEQYISNLEKFNVTDRVITIKERSEKSYHLIPEKIQLLWIDGFHEFEGVNSDYENYHRKIVSGGYLFFHDACWTTWTDPFKVIREKVLDNEEYNLFAMIDNTMVFKKERNKMPRFVRRGLGSLCQAVSGHNRPPYKRILSNFLLQATSFYSDYFGQLRCWK